MKIVGITGRAGAGKTSFANYLVEVHTKIHGNSASIVPFAKPLKDIATSMGWDGNKDEKGRKLLQLLGTDCGRDCIDPDLWIKKWLKTIQGLPRDCLVIADDLRFDNEADMVRSQKGLIIRIAGRNNRTVNSSHPSEAGICDDFMLATIDNTESLNNLKNKARTLWQTL